jgi:DNA repair and recombination protein RAD54B
VDYDVVYPQGYHKIKGPKNAEELLARVAPYYVRHLKKAQCCPHHPLGVMPWLPDKYYTPVHVDLAPAQRKAYQDMKKEMIAWVGEHKETPLIASVVIAQMMRLQQFACAFASVDSANSVSLVDPSSKLDAVMQILEDNEDESIVVFSQFNKLLHLLAERLERHKIEYVYYTGENRNTRDQDKRRFINGSARVFLGNISAGGVALDGLQEASSTVIFTDRLWSPGLNNQAEDRLWRDGQTNAVQVIDIIARDTVDLGRHQRIELTWNWIQQLLGDK